MTIHQRIGLALSLIAIVLATIGVALSVVALAS